VRIAFVTSRFPWPVEKGDKLRAFHQIRCLSEQHEIHLIAVSHKPVSKADIAAMEPFCKSIRIFRIRRWLLPVNLLLGWFEGLPLQVGYFFDRTIKRTVQYHIIHLDPDHVMCQLIRAAPYVRALPFTKTLDYMDVFSEGMRQMAKRYRLLAGFIFRSEASRLAAFERTIYKDFDRHTIISGQDRERLRLASHDHVAIIPNGVGSQFYHFEAKNKPTHDLVFVGNLGYGPNKHAANVLTEEILPLLRSKGVEPTLLIAGARPGRRLRKMGKLSGVTVQGWLDDIRDAYADGRIFVAPMFTGIGLQNKILEAMAMGLPCVTTPMVNNAIGAEPGREILVADTPEGIADYILYLMSDKASAKLLAEAGKQFVMNTYSWEIQGKKLSEILESENTFNRI